MVFTRLWMTTAKFIGELRIETGAGANRRLLLDRRRHG